MALRSSAALVLLLTATLARPAASQSGAEEGTVPSWMRGVTLGVNLNASTVRIGGPSVDNHRTGGGLGLTLGYGVSDRVSLLLRGNVAYQHAQYDLGARYSFGNGLSRFRPYVEGAVTHTLSREMGYGVRGPALTGGAGVDLFLNGKLSLDAGVSLSRGRFRAQPGVPDHAGAGETFRAGRFTLGLKLRQ